nr:RNA degradosome polyphosphate kinase [Lachnospiraceae bacterium]
MDKLSDPNYYYNRELSWLLFNERILGEARDKNNPLFERLKFLSITASNLDEFFMIRVASLKDMENAGYKKQDLSGMAPKEQLEKISLATHKLVDLQYSTLMRSLIPLLAEEGIHLLTKHEMLNQAQKDYVDEYFMTNIYPVLTPMAVDSSRPFPLIRNKSLNIGAILSKKSGVRGLQPVNEGEKGKKKKGEKGKEDREFATVQVPSGLPRMIVLPSEDDKTELILLEEVIERNIDKLFLNYDIIC